MAATRRDQVFAAFVDLTLRRDVPYWWRPRGASMAPIIGDGDAVLVAPVNPARLRRGDIVKFVCRGRLRMHRLIRRRRLADGTYEFDFRGDNSPAVDEAIPEAQVIGIARAVRRRGRPVRLDSLSGRWVPVVLRVSNLRKAAVRVCRYVTTIVLEVKAFVDHIKQL